ncbi:MAG: tyrosine-type recombinase/integrase [Opitutaceae bacterium]|nr:tyrosine-type recombinase/integrase [Opitutaceae bacterium]
MRIRFETTKDKDKRPIALHPFVARELGDFIPPNAVQAGLLPPNFPTYDEMRADLERAGIERKDGMGRVVHFHSYRKTWQTIGARSDVNQRAAQEMLGHSDPSLTAGPYTEMASWPMHEEVRKLPWLYKNAQVHAQKTTGKDVLGRFRQIVGELVTIVKCAGSEGFASDSELFGSSSKIGDMW